MSFCAIFIAILLERFFDYSHLRQWKWFRTYQKKVMQKMLGQSHYAVLAAMLLPLLLGVFVLDMFLSDVLFGFFKLFVSIVVILYCLGPRNLWADMFACLIDITNGDSRALADKLKISFGVIPTNGPQALHRELLTAIFIQSNRRVFSVLVWFGFLGLFGVVLYRMLTMIVGEAGAESLDPEVSSTASKLEGYMDWVSIRILTILFALGGNFSRVFGVWRRYAGRGFGANDTMLVDCGMAALNATTAAELPLDGSAEKEQVSLLDRSFAIMLVVLALLVFWIP